MNNDQLRATYDRLAPDYDRTVGRTERWLLGDLRHAFGALLSGETLEIAIGSGLNLPGYGPDVTRAVGVDLSLGMLARARQRAREAGRSVGLLQTSAERLPFPDASFDTVAVSLSLCTIGEPATALREMARVCRPTGRIVLLEHVRSPNPLIAGLQRLLTPLQERFIGCHLTRETIDLAASLGFTVESERRRLFSVVRLVIARPPGATLHPASPDPTLTLTPASLDTSAR
jgi:ubiquinone/menaquinone biosynthesis C-methylase UbiE